MRVHLIAIVVSAVLSTACSTTYVAGQQQTACSVDHASMQCQVETYDRMGG